MNADEDGVRTVNASADAEVTILPLGEVGVLVQLAGLDDVLRLNALVRRRRDEGARALEDVVDIVPAARTLGVTVAPGTDLGDLRRELRSLAERAAHEGGEGPGEEREVTIEVVYDGEDLEAVAEHTGLSPREVVEAHTGTPWRAAFGGFAPGFFYLVEGDPRLRVPRRDEPRTKVPAGAVALAGDYSAVYPRSTPGGWQLIGRTDAKLWDVEAEPPALLAPGMLVRFVEVTS